jgi:hypothetical protein
MIVSAEQKKPLFRDKGRHCRKIAITLKTPVQDVNERYRLFSTITDLPHIIEEI